MASKKAVVLYYEILEQLEDLTDEQFGKITRAILNYDKTGKIPEFDDVALKIAFKCVKPTIDRNKQDYQDKCEMQRQKIQDYWDRKKQEEQMNTMEYNGIQKNTDKDKDKDKDKDINKKNINNTSCVRVYEFASEYVAKVENKPLRELLEEFLKMRRENGCPIIGAEQLKSVLEKMGTEEAQILGLKELIGGENNEMY